MTTRILVTAAGGALAPLNIKLLRESTRHDNWVLAVDMQNNAAGRAFADAFATVPAGTDPGYVPAVIALIERYGINLVMPWSDEEALALATARDTVVAAGATLACTNTDNLVTMTNKAESFLTLERAGIDLPDWTLAKTPAELDTAFDDLLARHGEVALKPLVSRGNRNIYVIRRDITGIVDYMGSRETHLDHTTFRRDHLQDLAAHLPIMVMERLHAPAFDIDVLAWQGKVQRSCPRRRVNPAGIPFHGVVFDPRDDLIDLAERITAALDLSWLYDFDIMTTSDGRAVPIELNPRPSGSVAASIVAGLPFYDDLLSLYKDETPVARAEDLAGKAVLPYLACQVVASEDLA